LHKQDFAKSLTNRKTAFTAKIYSLQIYLGNNMI